MGANTEAGQAAERAWAAMMYEPGVLARHFDGAAPMPPDVALDHVQDVTGDRAGACRELLAAAADWLAGAAPPAGEVPTEYPAVACGGFARQCADHVHAGLIDVAEAQVREVARLAHDELITAAFRGGSRTPGTQVLWRYHAWAEAAAKALGLCRRVQAAV